MVVTGAAGFLGLKIVELLNTRGVNIQEIRGLDIWHSEPSFFLQNAEGGKLSYRRADICNYEEVSLCYKIEWQESRAVLCKKIYTTNGSFVGLGRPACRKNAVENWGFFKLNQGNRC